MSSTLPRPMRPPLPPPMPPVDPLSQWLGLLDARAVLSARLRARGRWSVGVTTDGPKVNAVVRGQCWLVHPDQSAPLSLSEGDAFVLAQPLRYVLTSDPALIPAEASDVFSGPQGWCDGGEGPSFEAIGCRIDVSLAHDDLLSRLLPPVIHVQAHASSASAVRWLIERLGTEVFTSSAGASASVDLMAQLLFVESIRHWAGLAGASAGALGVSGDPRLAQVLGRLHAAPAHAWRLEEMAELAGMSRSAFSQRFRQETGRAPLEYLIDWRLRLAARMLREDRAPLAEIAESVGYQSDSALSQAFKRMTGVSPASYRRTWRRESIPSMQEG